MAATNGIPVPGDVADASGLPRVEFHANIKWAPAYQRNNKANGQKNLRCFPSHCQGLGHQRGFCGHSIVVNFYYRPHQVKGELYSFSHFCIADCELASSAAAVAKGVSRERYMPGDVLSVDEVKRKVRQADAPLLEYIEGLELQDRRLDADGSVRVNFEFNRNLKGWHYGFLGSKLTRNVHHTYRAYVLEKVPGSPGQPEHFRVLAGVMSPDWTLFCRRRNRASIPTSSQVRQQHRNLMNQQQRQLQLQCQLEQHQQHQHQQHQHQREALHRHRHRPPFAVRSTPPPPPPLPPPPQQQQQRIPDEPDSPRRQVKKRRDSSPPDLAEHFAPFSGRSPRRYTSCPSSSEAADYLCDEQQQQQQHRRRRHGGGFPAYHQYYLSNAARKAEEEAKCESAGGGGRARGYTMPQLPSFCSEREGPVKHYLRRMSSQERLSASDRSGQSRKRTSSESHINECHEADLHAQYRHDEETKDCGNGNRWMVCFETAAQPDRRFKLLLALLRMVDLNFDRDNTDALVLRDPAHLQRFTATVTDVLDAFQNSAQEPPAHQGALSADETGFAQYLFRQPSFVAQMVAQAAAAPADRRMADPYGTTSFMLQVLTEHLRRFVDGQSKKSGASTEVGRLYPCMSSLSLKDSVFEGMLQHSHHHNKASPTALTPNTSSKGAAPNGSGDENDGPTKKKTATPQLLGEEDLERFTEDLEPLAMGEDEDEHELTLRATKSWKAFGNSWRLPSKTSQPLLASSHLSLLPSKLSEHSFMGLRRGEGSMLSLGRLPSALNLLEEHNFQEAAAGFKPADSSMKELDDFLKKECGVQEVEEVDDAASPNPSRPVPSSACSPSPSPMPSPTPASS